MMLNAFTAHTSCAPVTTVENGSRYRNSNLLNFLLRCSVSEIEKKLVIISYDSLHFTLLSNKKNSIPIKKRVTTDSYYRFFFFFIVLIVLIICRAYSVHKVINMNINLLSSWHIPWCFHTGCAEGQTLNTIFHLSVIF